MIRFVFID